MASHLVIVESPAKAKTIEKYLGKDYTVLASYGHVRDLVQKNGSVDTEHDYAMKYQLVERNVKHINQIASLLKKSDTLILATDPDREGEAISWHIYEYLREKNALKDKKVERVVFHEITKRAVQEAIAHPRSISIDLVNAQQARRALDYLVGFTLSPLLWRKVMPKLSAGRVQSPALRLICEREEEIDAFVPREYWTVEAETNKEKSVFQARLYTYAGQKVSQFSITNEADAKQAYDTLQQASGGFLSVDKIERKQRKRNPAPPFTTSTLQQEASRKLGFSANRTMRTAQQLYEGVDVGSGAEGLITYMRTDSVTLAQDAIHDIRDLITTRYGAHNVPDAPRVYKNKSKNAQEAHEAIRPTSAKIVPETLHGKLSSDQFRLYELIWKRTVACQMIPATLDTVAIDLGCGTENSFRATGSVIADPGFISVYQEGVDDAPAADGEDGKMLPELKEGEKLPLNRILTAQHFTEPPPRFSEASLVKALEEFGIGRPSTYASIISTLESREYVTLESRRFLPTDIGKIVSKFLSNNFTQYVDYHFTAKLEDELDEISRGEKEWIPVMDQFWRPFKELVDEKAETVTRQEVAQARELGTDPASGKPVSVRIGRYGPFAQIGTKDDEEKPRFASLRSEQRLDSITLEQALALFVLPRDLGETDDGEKLRVSIGRFGPYVQYGKKYVSLKEDDPYQVTRERALEIVAAHIKAEAEKRIKTFPEAGVEILNGRWGPYITNGAKNAKIPKDTDPTTLSLETCLEWLEAAPEKKGRTTKKAAVKAPAKKTATKESVKKVPAKKAATKKAATPKKAAAKQTTKKTPAKTTSKASTKKTTTEKTE